MSARLLAILMAAALTVTGMTPTGARAGDRDTARAIATIAGIAIIGAAIHDHQRHSRQRGHVSTRGYYHHNAHRQHRAHRRAHRRHLRQHRAFRQHFGYGRSYRAHRWAY